VTLDAGGQQTGVKRYYAIGGQPIAVRESSGTFYLLTDHLGSVVTVLDAPGAVVGEQRYRPFGQPRLTPGITQTDRGFTGQQSLSAVGLVDFNARWVDASLGMFASPDSLIPNLFNPQALNRYAYVANNPLRYTDPTGHRFTECGQFGEECGGSVPLYVSPTIANSNAPVRIAADELRPIPPMSAQEAVDEFCTTTVCKGTDIGALYVDFGVFENLFGYDPGVASIPVHTGQIATDKTQANQLFPWEGAGNVAYAEHRQLHPSYATNLQDLAYFTQYWIGDAVGIIQTMIFRAEDEYEWRAVDTPNEAAYAPGTQYASPMQDLSDPAYAEFQGLAFSVIVMGQRTGPVPWNYDYFGHYSLNPVIREDRTDRASFNPWGWGIHYYEVPPIPAVYE